MTTQKNNFVIDPSATLIEWLRLIGPLLTEGMGGLFSERDDNLLGIKAVLDLGCGPGDWVISVASALAQSWLHKRPHESARDRPQRRY